MAYIYSFCFNFSLRLGTIIVGFISLIQGLLMVTCFALGICYPDEITYQIRAWMSENDFVFMEPFFDSIAKDPMNFMIGLLIFSLFYTLSCGLLIYGAFTITNYLMYLYICFEFIRLVGLFATHIAAMLLIKENIINLGLLIGMSVFGGFILLGLFYMWFCALNLIIVVRDLLRETQITDITNFPKQAAPMPDIYTINRPKYFNY